MNSFSINPFISINIYWIWNLNWIISISTYLLSRSYIKPCFSSIIWSKKMISPSYTSISPFFFIPLINPHTTSSCNQIIWIFLICSYHSYSIFSWRYISYFSCLYIIFISSSSRTTKCQTSYICKKYITISIISNW